MLRDWLLTVSVLLVSTRRSPGLPRREIGPGNRAIVSKERRRRGARPRGKKRS